MTTSLTKTDSETMSSAIPSPKIIQFDWSRRWKKCVEPHLKTPLVRASIEMGMRLYDRDWLWEHGPHAIGRGQWNGQKVRNHKLSWYQPWGRCHWISFFGCAIGVLNYPELDWQFISGHCHTVAAGSGDGKCRVVMDILNFKMMPAEQSIAHAQLVPPGIHEPVDLGWSKVFNLYVESAVPALRQLAHQTKTITCGIPRLVRPVVRSGEDSRSQAHTRHSFPPTKPAPHIRADGRLKWHIQPPRSGLFPFRLALSLFRCRPCIQFCRAFAFLGCRFCSPFCDAFAFLR
jgi:hypothetical protein